jgi:hypothetical protein
VNRNALESGISWFRVEWSGPCTPRSSQTPRWGLAH